MDTTFKSGAHIFLSTSTIITYPHLYSYRTLSIHVENTKDEKTSRPAQRGKQESSQDPAQAIRDIDVHYLNVHEVYRRYSIAPKVGLEAASVERKAKLGRNVISPPPTQYWKKILNYVFGGFNFLMWIAFILTVVCEQHDVAFAI